MASTKSNASKAIIQQPSKLPLEVSEVREATHEIREVKEATRNPTVREMPYRPSRHDSQPSTIPQKPSGKYLYEDFPIEYFNRYFSANYLNQENEKQIVRKELQQRFFSDNQLIRAIPDILQNINQNDTLYNIQDEIRKGLDRNKAADGKGRNLLLLDDLPADFTQTRLLHQDLNESFSLSSSGALSKNNKTLIDVANALDTKREQSSVLKDLHEKVPEIGDAREDSIMGRTQEKIIGQPLAHQTYIAGEHVGGAPDSKALKYIPDKCLTTRLHHDPHISVFGNIRGTDATPEATQANLARIPLANSELDKTISRYIREVKRPPPPLYAPTIDNIGPNNGIALANVKMVSESLQAIPPSAIPRDNGAIQRGVYKKTQIVDEVIIEADNIYQPKAPPLPEAFIRAANLEKDQANLQTADFRLLDKKGPRGENKAQGQMAYRPMNKVDADPAHLLSDLSSTGRSKFDFVDSLNQSFIIEKKNELSRHNDSRSVILPTLPKAAEVAASKDLIKAAISSKLTTPKHQANILESVFNIILIATSLMIHLFKNLLTPSNYKIEYVQEAENSKTPASVVLRLPYSISVTLPYSTYDALIKSAPIVAFLAIVYAAGND